jgi:predicted lipoprotein with Yx(FWY)xxD motif
MTPEELIMSRLRSAAFPIVLGATALVAVSCGSGGGEYGQSTATSASAPAGVAPTTTIGLAGSPLGSLLVDQQGRTVYLFERDASGVSTCYDACAVAWPPVLTSGAPAAAVDVSRGDLGTTVRRDGAHQVTYHGHPLYLFAGDRKPGDTAGQGLEAFGAEWYVVGADGRPIDAS